MRGNLTEEEKEGLNSLQKRMKEKEIIILKTDKSGKIKRNMKRWDTSIQRKMRK